MDHEKLRQQVHQGIDRHCAPLTSDPYRVQRVMNAERMEGGQIMGKKLSRFAVVMIVLMVLSLSTAIAAGVISWHRGLEDMLRVSDDTKNYYQSSELFDTPNINVTQGDVTVTLEQSIVDTNAAYFAFRVKGFQPLTGQQPAFAATDYTIDDESLLTNCSASFFDGLVVNNEGRAVYPDGSIPEDYSALPYTDANGEMVYIIKMLSKNGSLIGHNMKITLTDLGVYADKWGTHEVQAPGTWTFEWTLKGDEHYCDFTTLNLDIGASGSKVTKVHLSPIHIQMTMDVALTLQEYEKHEDGDTFIPYFCGLKMKDGRMYELITEGGMTGYTSPDPEETEYQILFALNRIIEPDQVASLLFYYSTETGERLLTEVPFPQLP